MACRRVRGIGPIWIFGSGKAVFGGGLVDKFGFKQGDAIDPYDKYEDKTHTLPFTGDEGTWGEVDHEHYMSLDDFDAMFGNDAAYFNGYASDEPLTLDSRYVASDLTPSDMDAIGEQFTGMMDDMIGMLVGMSVFIFLVFMYLLTKSVIDHSARSISYMKVFGYRDREVSKLYVRSITWCVVASLIVCQPLIIASLTAIFKAMLLSLQRQHRDLRASGSILEVIATGFATYLVVALLHAPY